MRVKNYNRFMDNLAMELAEGMVGKSTRYNRQCKVNGHIEGIRFEDFLNYNFKIEYMTDINYITVYNLINDKEKSIDPDDYKTQTAVIIAIAMFIEKIRK